MNPLVRLVMASYRIVLRSGFLDTPVGRALFNRSYMVYKQLVEARYSDRLLDLIKPGTYVIDVGANIGFFTRKFARTVSQGGKVIAIEPEPHNFAELGQLLSQNHLEQNVVAYQVAAAENEGQLFLKIDPYHPANHKLSQEGLPVKVTTIDRLVQEQHDPVVSLIKIDVQGAEKRVLAGSLQTIHRCRPAIYLEVDDDALRVFESSASDLISYLMNLDYTPHQLTKTGISAGLTVEQACAIQHASNYTDLLFFRESDRSTGSP